MSKGGFIAAIAIAAACAGGCDDGPTTPSSAAIVTFRVSNNEQFLVRLTTPEQVAAAHAAFGGGPAKIPNGRIVAGTQVNAPWNWHLEDVEFAEATVEVCDGRPSDVERLGTGFGGGRFCPWSAMIIRIDEQ